MDWSLIDSNFVLHCPKNPDPIFSTHAEHTHTQFVIRLVIRDDLHILEKIHRMINTTEEISSRSCMQFIAT